MKDLISRQALCEYALNQKDKCVTPNDIMRFPSAQPDSKESSVTQKALDTISRQAAIDAVRRSEALDRAFGYGHAVDALRELPHTQPDLSEYSDKLWEKAYERGKAEAQAQLEEAYISGETEAEARYHAEIVRCKECRYYKSDGCFFSTAEVGEDGFCSWAERRIDDKT